MRDEPSATAAVVAAWRGWGRTLPAEARLVDDPYGASFGGRWVLRLPRALTVPVWPLALYMQVRTRAIDDALRAFLADGGRQVLILGAGYDCRAARLPELAGAAVFEVDHPATQARKRSILAETPGARVRYLPWNFEERPVGELPAALAALGHDPAVPTLTIWEGVTMYLHEPAIDATVRAVAALSAPTSPFVVTWVDRRALESPSLARRAVSWWVARLGEPFVFGWLRSELPGWFAQRGFTVERDRELAEIAAELLPERWARVIRRHGQRIAVVRRGSGGESPGATSPLADRGPRETDA